jgi:hypothetical protein
VLARAHSRLVLKTFIELLRTQAQSSLSTESKEMLAICTHVFRNEVLFRVRSREIIQGPQLLDCLLGAKMPSMLKIVNFSISSYVVNIKVYINHQKTFCKDMFIQFRFIVSQSL